ncbi:sulfatase-like hydrolase/transferase [Persicitalea jodogahamensis]|uniref:Acetylglucosamine-6-sulfatase n=1 Tax=Persicitalea jodogahamensis TaxID=402147 RepID=A0A8J3D522_9BACT|nr:sulfatase-like hydrolase/transferase [Persicitalea jodogahamensis]GHB54271.1 acetylglucosamine-6-sulfatase [Persicitalea jodogahamensis]
MIYLFLMHFLLSWLAFPEKSKSAEKPNFIILLVDDQRWDALSYGKNTYFTTPELAKLAAQGTYFPDAFVTLSICTPSRAAILSGQYGSRNGVMDMGSRLKDEPNALGNIMKNNGYATAVFGKWHLPNQPDNLGFDYSFIFKGITTYWDVDFLENGKKKSTDGFVDDQTIDQTVDYLKKRDDRPFFLFVNTFAPHMDENYDWPIKAAERSHFDQQAAPLPADWNTDFEGKPAYLKSERPHQRALEYGYDRPDSIRSHVYKYAAANYAMDQAVGRLSKYLTDEKLLDNTYLIVLGDNGWFMAEHGLTSKVLAYEESMRVPFFVLGPKVAVQKSDEMVLNVDLYPTILDLAGIQKTIHSQSISLKKQLSSQGKPKRNHVFYEAPVPVHGTYPHYAIRTKTWKYIVTYHPEKARELYSEELYDLRNDPKELKNLAADSGSAKVLAQLRKTAQKEIQNSNQ